jgi:hypothetical protein
MNRVSIDLDDVRRHVIIALAADDELGELLVLKGANALRLVHEMAAAPRWIWTTPLKPTCQIPVQFGRASNTGWLGSSQASGTRSMTSALRRSLPFHEIKISAPHGADGRLNSS